MKHITFDYVQYGIVFPIQVDYDSRCFEIKPSALNMFNILIGIKSLSIITVVVCVSQMYGVALCHELIEILYKNHKSFGTSLKTFKTSFIKIKQPFVYDADTTEIFNDMIDDDFGKNIDETSIKVEENYDEIEVIYDWGNFKQMEAVKVNVINWLDLENKFESKNVLLKRIE